MLTLLSAEAGRGVERGGVIVSDAVGLGKRRKGFIPKGLVWEPKLNEYGIKAEVTLQESRGRVNLDWKAFNGYDVSLMDESLRQPDEAARDGQLWFGLWGMVSIHPCRSHYCLSPKPQTMRLKRTTVARYITGEASGVD